MKSLTCFEITKSLFVSHYANCEMLTLLWDISLKSLSNQNLVKCKTAKVRINLQIGWLKCLKDKWNKMSNESNNNNKLKGAAL